MAFMNIRGWTRAAFSRTPSIEKEISDINALEAEMQAMSDDEMRDESVRLKTYALELPEQVFDHKLVTRSFALVREAAKRVLGQRPYDVQLYGGLILHKGKIAEMRTGEGKTLVAALPTYLNALKGKGVHVITVNDYLALRDASMIGKIHQFLGLSVGIVLADMPDYERARAYACDITYATNSQVGFDYLRDNLRFDASQMVQRGHYFAIVDEVDSVLIDEARTPLIISGELPDQSETYRKIDGLVKKLNPNDDYKVDLETKSVSLTEKGLDTIDRLFHQEGLIDENIGLFTYENTALVHHLNAALRANTLFKKDKDYLIRNGEVVIIDEGTGRLMDGRRYNDGIHQAIEAKEGVEIKNESQTLTSITYQNLFRMYGKLSGMSGTAKTEEEEFQQIYGLDVVVVPTHRPVKRIDMPDEIHLTQSAKYDAIIKLIEKAHAKGQPVLVGTPSVEKSEILADRLRNAGFVEGADNANKGFRLLNARNHQAEAEIISQAGRLNAITIATNMAGRGTDIKLGGNFESEIAAISSASEIDENEKVARIKAIEEGVDRERQKCLDAGGLLVIGTERHESRRIDNQLRGRSGRQGDPGVSQFFVSIEDDVIRVFGSNKIKMIVSGLGLQEGDAISHPLVTKMLNKAQQKIENIHFEHRKDVVKYDDVVNQQRTAMHEFRQEIMTTNNCANIIDDMRHDLIEQTVLKHVPEHSLPYTWDIDGLQQELLELLTIGFDMTNLASKDDTDAAVIIDKVIEKSDFVVDLLRDKSPPDMYEIWRKEQLLVALDQGWREHLTALEELKSVVGFRGYAQREPINEFRTDAFEMFRAMMDQIEHRVVYMTSRIRPPEKPVLINPETPATEEETAQ